MQSEMAVKFKLWFCISMTVEILLFRIYNFFVENYKFIVVTNDNYV